MGSRLKRVLTGVAVLGALSGPALVGWLSGPAGAQTPANDERLNKMLNELVTALDANKDGTLDDGELRGVTSAMKSPAESKRPDPLVRWDADKDGTISREEYVAFSSKRFERLDTNGDGRLDEAERAASYDKWREKRAHRRGEEERGRDRWERARDGDDHRHGGRWKPERQERANSLFDYFDKDGDGIITRDEAEAGRGTWKREHGGDRG